MSHSRHPHSDRLGLEHCVTTPGCAAMGARAGVDRFELCSALELGGLTPSMGIVDQVVVAAKGIPVRVMVRPRSGDFIYDTAELRAMQQDIRDLAQLGVEGIVIGAARRNGHLDLDALSRLIEAAGTMRVTLHRVFDLCPDLGDALEQAIELGCNCILTSGGAARAPEAIPQLRALAAQANGRIDIMAGGGVTAASIPDLAATGVTMVHGSFSAPAPQSGGVERIGIPATIPRADADRLQAAVAACSFTKLEPTA